jgi:hypothetical protein
MLVERQPLHLFLASLLLVAGVAFLVRGVRVLRKGRTNK